MNNLRLYENTILVKADTKTQEFLTEWVQVKREDWLSKQQKQGVAVDMDLLDEQEAKGMVLPFEKQLIP
jgi:hypothetical protein